MTNNKIKLQHYVPRFYLKRFANIDGNNHILDCFDKFEEKQFNTDVMDIACEKFFYDTQDDTEQETEKALSLVEGRFNEYLSKLIKFRDVSKISNEERYFISMFIAVQYIRTKENREMLKDSINQLAERLSGENLSPKLAREIKEAQKDESIKKMQVRLLRETPQFADIIYQMKWIIISNGTKTPFWTSDNPVALHNEINQWPYGNLGLKCIGIELHLPLTPTLLLVTCDPIAFCREPDKKTLRDFRYIIREQSYQVYSSTRFIFSNQPNFSFAKKVITENPKHKDPNRKRIVLS
ncbi:MAG: DUF4238 domain-containing protein [Nanoarchaeota archaeon]